MKRALRAAVILCAVILLNHSSQRTVAGTPQTSALSSLESQQALKDRYCAGCHNDKLKSGGFSWTVLDVAHPEQNAELAEKVIRKIRSGMMPPAGAPRPDFTTMKSFASALETR